MNNIVLLVIVAFNETYCSLMFKVLRVFIRTTPLQIVYRSDLSVHLNVDILILKGAFLVLELDMEQLRRNILTPCRITSME